MLHYLNQHAVKVNQLQKQLSFEQAKIKRKENEFEVQYRQQSMVHDRAMDEKETETHKLQQQVSAIS